MKRFLPVVVLSLLAVASTQAQNFPQVTIQQIQYASQQALAAGNDLSQYHGDTVVVEGVVTFNPCAYGLSSGNRVGTWLQDGTGPWSGVHVLIDPGASGLQGQYTLAALDAAVQFIDNFSVGNRVKATGIITDFNHNTQIVLLPFQSEVVSFAAMPAPVVVTIDSFAQNDGGGTQIQQLVTGEPYEGVYVQFNNVQIVDVSLGTGANTGRVFWSLQDAQGNLIRIRDVSGHFRNDTLDNFCTAVGSFTPIAFAAPQVNSTVAYVRGIIVEHKPASTPYEFTLAPLTPSDLGPQIAAAPVITNVKELIAVPSTSQTQTISATITDPDGTVASAVLFYSIGLGSASFISVPMTNTGGAVWTGNIPAIPTDSTYVIYYIAATDNDGNTTNFPNTLATNSYYLVLNGGITSIHHLQFNPLGLNDSPYRNQALTGINITATVMSTTGLTDLGFVVLQDGSGPWSGIALANSAVVISGPGGVHTLQRGALVNITAAKVYEDNTVTRLDSITYTVVSNNNPLHAPVTGLNIDSVALGKYNHTEPYESMLVQFNNVFVVNQNPDAPAEFGEWAIYPTVFPVNPLRVDDYSNDIPFSFGTDSLTLNQELAFVRGILTRSFGNWKLLPRNKDDIAGFFTVSSVKDLSAYKAISVYPNPVANELNVRFGGNVNGTVNWQMTDATGRVLNQSVLRVLPNDVVAVPMENLAAGVYFIRVQTHQGVQTVQVVKD